MKKFRLILTAAICCFTAMLCAGNAVYASVGFIDATRTAPYVKEVAYTPDEMGRATGGGYEASVVDYSFNTENIIHLYGANASQAAEEIKKAFKEIDETFSLTKDSQIKKLNRDGVLYNASDDVIYLMAKAKQLYERTDGAFNPATYLLTDLWQLSSRFSQNDGNFKKPYDRQLYTLPEQKYIDAFKKLLNFEDVKIIINVDTGENKIELPTNTVAVDGVNYKMQIDLGGIVKGFAAEKAKEIAKKFNITDGYITLGGSSIVLFNNPESDDGKFNVGVLNPDNVGAYYAISQVKNIAMSTSGDYQAGKYFELAGKKYCHVINGKTGRPVDGGIRTVTIFCDDAITADAMTTALMVMGFDSAKEFINGNYFKQNQIKASFVYQKSWLLGSVREVVSNTSKEFFNITDSAFKHCGFMNDGNFVYDPLMPNLWLFLGILGVAAIAIVVVVIKKDKVKTQTDLKAQKFFKIADLFIYGAILACVVVLFLGFVIFKPQVDLNYIEVYCQNNRIFIYDANSGEGIVTDKNFVDSVTVENVNGKTVLTIKNGNLLNKIEFNGKYAKMTEANCSNTKECVNIFHAVTDGGQTIICDVSHIKVVGVGDAQLPILNG